MRPFLYLLMLTSLFALFAILSLYQYNQYYSKKYVEFEKYIDSINKYLNDTYKPDRFFLLDIDDRNNSIRLIFALIYNDSTFTPSRYHIDFVYPDYNFAEVDQYMIRLSNCIKEACRLIYPEDVIFNLGLIKPHLRLYTIKDKYIQFENGIWNVKLITDVAKIEANMSFKGDLLYYLEN